MFKSKVTALKASKTRVYPSIRLPREYSKIIGSTAEIIPTSHEGKQAFLVVIDHDSLNSEPLNTLEARLEAVEKQLSLLQESASKDTNAAAGIRTRVKGLGSLCHAAKPQPH